MYGLKIDTYVPVPKPVSTDKIIAAHYYPAWEKGGAVLHGGFDDLHDYPERTPIQGYYDGENPQEIDWEIKWATEHGVNCFIFCWYRKKDNVGKLVTRENLRLGETLYEGLFQSRYGGKMKFAIMFEVQNRWGATNAQDITENLLPFWMKEYFMRDNYMKIDGKPVLFVYDYQNQLRSNFPSAEEQKKTFDACRQIAKQYGFNGMIFAIEYRFEDLSVEEDYKARGYDFCFPYCWDWKQPEPSEQYIVDRQLSLNKQRIEKDPHYYVPAVSCMWDPKPRFWTMPELYNEQVFPSRWKLSPEGFRRVIRGVKEMMEKAPNDSLASKILVIDNWNEWDEGHYIMPSVEFGFGYLQAIREELTARDNLPDYRTPDIIGTPKLNQTWDEPDFSNIVNTVHE